MLKEQRRDESMRDEAPVEATAASPSSSMTKFSDAGPLPAVAGQFGSAGPSASERAFDDPKLPKELLEIVARGDVAALVEMLHAYPTLRTPIMAAIEKTHGAGVVQQVGQSVPVAHTAQPTRVAEADTAATTPKPARPIHVATNPQSDRQKVAGWEAVARGRPSEQGAPSHVRLPDSVVEALDKAWRDSTTNDGHDIEQGGNLVRTYGGDYEVRRGHNRSDSDEYDPDYNDVGFMQTLVGIVHTHPYREDGFENGTFSDVDMANLVDQDQPLNILRSGNQTYMISRTKEFDQIVAKHEKADTLFELKRDIIDTYNKAFKAVLDEMGSRAFPAALENGVLAVCEKFHLAYYWGQGRELHRTTR